MGRLSSASAHRRALFSSLASRGGGAGGELIPPQLLCALDRDFEMGCEVCGCARMLLDHGEKQGASVESDGVELEHL